ncbi:MAG: ABC transporter permease [Bacteroidota bacterium]|nr:ABC transporter permease [Bacteroidota bacterium]
MLKNYFVIAFRNILRNKLFSIINILGLSIGIACSFLIILDVQDDLSYDQFFENNDDIYRVVLDRIYPENIVSYAIIPHSYAHVFVSDIPEVEESTRIVNAGGEFIVTIDDKVFKEEHACAVDSNFFDFFGIPVIKGDPKKALAVLNGIMLSETTSQNL